MKRAYMKVKIEFIYCPSTPEAHEAEISEIMKKAARGLLTMDAIPFESGALSPMEWEFDTPEQWRDRDLLSIECENGEKIRKPEKVKQGAARCNA